MNLVSLVFFGIALICLATWLLLISIKKDSVRFFPNIIRCGYFVFMTLCFLLEFINSIHTGQNWIFDFVILVIWVVLLCLDFYNMLRARKFEKTMKNNEEKV